MGVRLTFGEWLGDQLRVRGWTQAAFADLVGTARTTVNTWVNDVTPPRRRAARDIAKALGVEIDEVLVRAGYPPTEPGYTLPEDREAEEAGEADDFSDIDEEVRVYFLNYKKLPPHFKRLLRGQLRAYYQELEELAEIERLEQERGGESDRGGGGAVRR